MIQKNVRQTVVRHKTVGHKREWYTMKVIKLKQWIFLNLLFITWNRETFLTYIFITEWSVWFPGFSFIKSFQQFLLMLIINLFNQIFLVDFNICINIFIIFFNEIAKLKFKSWITNDWEREKKSKTKTKLFLRFGASIKGRSVTRSAEWDKQISTSRSQSSWSQTNMLIHHCDQMMI